MVAFIMTAMTKVQAQNFEGPCLPSEHGLDGHQSAFCGSTETQTISLVEGWNWVSIGIAVEDPVEMFEMLTASLGDNATEIQAFDFMSEYDDGDWEGDLNEEGLTNEQMYLIYAVSDCTIELQGMPAVASEYEITLNPGWNWIGFPSAEPIEVAVALADFADAEDGDEIQSLDYTIEYLDGEWEGDLEVFEPGQGLLYNNTTDEVKTLVFSTGAKKATRRTVSNLGTLQQVAPRVVSIGKTESIVDPTKKKE